MELPVYKVVFVGDGGVGKTSLIRRYCEGKFEQTRMMTIGVDFQTKIVETPMGPVKLSIWDLAGQPHFKSVRESFYSGGDVVVLVYDLTDINSLKNLVDWYKEVRQFLPDIPYLLVGNKADLLTKNEPYGKIFAEKIKSTILQTSASSGEGVEDLFQSIGRLISD